MAFWSQQLLKSETQHQTIQDPLQCLFYNKTKYFRLPTGMT